MAFTNRSEIFLKRHYVTEEECEEKDEARWIVVVEVSIIEIEEVEKVVVGCSEEEEREEREV